MTGAPGKIAKKPAVASGIACNQTTRRCLTVEAIAQPGQIHDFSPQGIPKLPAQGGDMNLDRVGVDGRRVSVPPNRMIKMGGVNDYAALAHQHVQKVELLAGEGDVAAAHGDLARAQIKDQS